MTKCLFFGDSITYGEYDGIYGGWVDILKRYCHAKYNEGTQEVNIFNLGIGGETTEGLLQRLEVESYARKSEKENLIFLAYGANDLAIMNEQYVVSSEQFRKNFQIAISKVREITTKIFIIDILPISQKIDGVIAPTGKLRTNKNVNLYNEILFEIAQENNVTHVNVHSLFLDNFVEELLSKDGIHPNEKGYELIANFMKPIVNQYL